jgi:hypothetical protein
MNKAILATTLVCVATLAHSQSSSTVPVTVNNFVRAETDLYFTNSANAGGFGGWHHIRELLPIDHQSVIRGNRDTLYSTRVFDLEAGPATIALPDAGERYMSLQIISEDEYTTTEYGAGPHTLDKAKIGTRYAPVSAPWSIRTIPAM